MHDDNFHLSEPMMSCFDPIFKLFGGTNTEHKTVKDFYQIVEIIKLQLASNNGI